MPISPLILIYENTTPEESVKVIGFLLLTTDPLGLEVNSNVTVVGTLFVMSHETEKGMRQWLQVAGLAWFLPTGGIGSERWLLGPG